MTTDANSAPPAPALLAPLLPDATRQPTLTIDEAAAVLRISKWSAYKAAKSGQLDTIRIGGSIRVPTAQLLAKLGLPT